MKCVICSKKSQTRFCKKHLEMLSNGWIVCGWKISDDGPYYIGEAKKLDETDKRLNQTVRQGKAHGKNINNLRSKMKNGQWHYEYIK